VTLTEQLLLTWLTVLCSVLCAVVLLADVGVSAHLIFISILSCVCLKIARTKMQNPGIKGWCIKVSFVIQAS
jgi:hypothetical protein